MADPKKPTLSNLWNREPMMVLHLAQALLALLVTFGLQLSAEQIGLVLGTMSALMAVLTNTNVPIVSTTPKKDAANGE